MGTNTQTIHFKDVVTICKKYMDNPSQKNLEEYNKMLNSLVIQEYLPCERKAVAVTKILLKADSLYGAISAGFSSMGLDIELLLDGLLSYTNIDPESITDDFRNFSVMDILSGVGIDSYLLQFCERDYARLEKQVERAITYSNLEALINALSTIDPKEFDESIAKVQTMMNNFNTEQLNALRDIIAFNDPNLYKLRETIDDNSLEKIMRMDRLEKIQKSTK